MYLSTLIRVWAKQKNENYGLYRNFMNGFWFSYLHVQVVLFYMENFFTEYILCVRFSLQGSFQNILYVWNKYAGMQK